MRPLTDRHPGEGTLRRLVDEPAGVADADRAHVAGCPTCLRGLSAAREEAVAGSTALACDARPEVSLAWRRFTAAEAPARAAPPAPARRRRSVLRSPLVAVLGV